MNLAGLAGWHTTWSESCGLASEPLCTGFFSTLLDRDPQAVQADLADGHISPDYAIRHHRLKSLEPPRETQSSSGCSPRDRGRLT